MAHEIESGVADIVAKEITLKEARELFKAYEDQLSSGGFESEPWEDISMAEIKKMTGYSTEKLESLPMSDLRKVADACRKANPDFFGKKDRQLKELERVRSLSPESLDRLLSVSEKSGNSLKQTLPGLPG